MSFIRCDNCSWSQDDFWSVEGLNPFHEDTIKQFRNALKKGLNGEKIEIDINFAQEKNIEYEEVNGKAYVDFKEIIVLDLERLKRIVLNMVWPTLEDFKKDPKQECPQCGSSEDWSIN